MVLFIKVLTSYQLIDILSIDRKLFLEGDVENVGGVIIKLSVKSKEKEVEIFLVELKRILCRADFCADNELYIIRSKKKGKEQYSTPYTLVDLEYDASDVVERLKELTVREYSETLIDKDDVNPPLLYVFGKNINGRLVYIKLKIKGTPTRHILCVSFHYAENAMQFPYT